ncbi:MAG: transglycosylase SLT domain-containing protein, partial [Candidatus Binatia bacterium]
PEARAAREQAWVERETVALRSRRAAEEEIKRLLSEGVPQRALELARLGLDRFRLEADRAALDWLEASALLRSGKPAEAEAALEALRRRFPRRREAAAALYRLGTLAWNRDDDRTALQRFELYVRSHPSGADAAESLYAIGRIHQQAGRLHEATRVFERLVRSYPRSDLAPEAAWRIGWCEYQARNFPAAARSFDRFVPARSPERPAALYWKARALERSNGRARDAYEHILRDHPATYYAMLAEGRLGRSEGEALAMRSSPPETALLGNGSPHLARLAELREMRLFHLARLELAAFEAVAPRDESALLAAWLEVEGFRESVRGAARLDSCRPESPLVSFCYPLAFWSAVRRESERFRVDPFLVVSLMRQESLFDPLAVSPANALGLMQLLPSTAERTVRNIGRSAVTTEELFDAERNLEIGVAHLRELLDRYGGNEPRSLAAYNAGAAAVEKWDRRHPGVEDDEFVDSISYRETRNYVKRVLQNRRIYRALYGDPTHIVDRAVTAR